MMCLMRWSGNEVMIHSGMHWAALQLLDGVCSYKCLCQDKVIPFVSFNCCYFSHIVINSKHIWSNCAIVDAFPCHSVCTDVTPCYAMPWLCWQESVCCTSQGLCPVLISLNVHPLEINVFLFLMGWSCQLNWNKIWEKNAPVFLAVNELLFLAEAPLGCCPPVAADRPLLGSCLSWLNFSGYLHQDF